MIGLIIWGILSFLTNGRVERFAVTQANEQ